MARERGLLGVAAVGAIVLHLIALVAPLPSRGDVDPQHVTVDDGPWIRRPVLPPPELPEPHSRAVRAPLVYRVAVPFGEPPAVEPLGAEPAIALEGVGVELDVLVPPVAVPPPTRVLEEGTPGLQPPRLLGERTRPRYPESARLARREGRVVLVAVIGVDGVVVSLEILSAPRPDPGFADSAMEAVSAWRYAPGRYRGRAVAVRLRVVVDFTLR